MGHAWLAAVCSRGFDQKNGSKTSFLYFIVLERGIAVGYKVVYEC